MYTTIYKTYAVLALLTTPCLCMLAYRTWTMSIRHSLSRTRSALGITSVVLTSLNWLALMGFLAIEKARLRSGFGAYIKSQIAMIQDTFVSVSFLLLIVAVILGFALQKSARIQAVGAGLLMVAFWIVGILGRLN